MSPKDEIEYLERSISELKATIDSLNSKIYDIGKRKRTLYREHKEAIKKEQVNRLIEQGFVIGSKVMTTPSPLCSIERGTIEDYVLHNMDVFVVVQHEGSDRDYSRICYSSKSLKLI